MQREGSAGTSCPTACVSERRALRAGVRLDTEKQEGGQKGGQEDVAEGDSRMAKAQEHIHKMLAVRCTALLPRLRVLPPFISLSCLLWPAWQKRRKEALLSCCSMIGLSAWTRRYFTYAASYTYIRVWCLRRDVVSS